MRRKDAVMKDDSVVWGRLMRRKDAVIKDDGVAWGRLIDEERGCCDQGWWCCQIVTGVVWEEVGDGLVKEEVGVI